MLEHIFKTPTVPCQQSRVVSFTSSIIKKTVAASARLRFPAELVICIAFRSASSACCILKSIATNFIVFIEIIIV